ITRDKLLGYRWPDTGLEQARNALSQVIFVLRKGLGPDFVIQTAAAMRLNADVITSDLTEFEDSRSAGEFERAVAAYGGPFLDGFHLTNAPAFERWVDVERTRLDRDYADALRRLATAAEQSADWSAAAGWWKQLAALDPLSGAVAASLMKALAAAGDSAAALRHGQQYGSFVQEELGVAPDPAVLGVAERIRVGTAPATARPQNGNLPVPLEFARRAKTPVAAPDETQPAAPSPVFLRRKTVMLGVAGVALSLLATAVGISWRVGHPTLDPHRVVVASAPPAGRKAGNDPLDAMLRERLGDGVAETHFASVVPGASVVLPADQDRGSTQVEQAVALARANGARFVVTSTYDIDAESVLLRAQIVDAETGSLAFPIESVHGVRSAPEPAIEVLRSRVMAVLAARLDPKLDRWSYAAAMPRTYESYRELRLGIDSFVGDDFEEATSHFQAAAALDTTSATPLVWAAFALGYHRFWPQVEVLVDTLKQSGRTFGPWDRAVLDVVDAWLTGDLAGGHAASHRLAAVVPNSEWSLPLAWDAGNLGRGKEAVRVMRGIDPERGWMQGFVWYWWSLLNAYHFIGDHATELEGAREALRREPSNRGLMRLEIRALAALGREREIEERCIDARTLRANSMIASGECALAVGELRAHGYPRAARTLREMVLAEFATHPDIQREEMAEIYDAFGDIAASDSISNQQQPATPYGLSRRALGAAARGDRVGVEQALRAIEAAPGPRPPRDARKNESLALLRAQVAALLGDRNDAVNWLNVVFQEGFWDRRLLHTDPALNGLRGYPPFEAMIRPTDDPEFIPP
ncbi:MAG: BTAD domain-containing putative transcriptional regulator, partial [Mycobacteriales bacterium]